MPDCQLCRPATDHTTPIYHDGGKVRVYECDTCGDPVVTLTAHTSDPSLDTEAYALGIARGLFGPGAAFCDTDHGMPAAHWAAHVDVPTA